MKILIIILATIALLYSKPSVKLDKDVILMVNGVKITKAQLDRGVKALFPARYYHGTISDEKMKEFEKTVLDELLEKELIFQHAKSIGIKIPESNVDDSIEKIKTVVKGPKNFNELLKKAEITLKILRDNIYKEEVLIKFNKEKIEATVTQEDLKNYYNKNKYKFKEPEKIVARVIYVKNDPTDPDGKIKARTRIEEAYQKIKDGEDFADVATKYSTAMSRIKGGDLGYVHKGMLEPVVEETAFSMDANTTSEIIEVTIGFYIVKVEEKVEPNQLSFETIKKGLKKDLKEKIEKERKSSLLKRLKLTAVIIK